MRETEVRAATFPPRPDSAVDKSHTSTRQRGEGLLPRAHSKLGNSTPMAASLA